VFVTGGATILHADLDAFYASVEQRDDPHLLGRPVIVGAGVVLAASYEAKAFGVRTAMGGAQARALCPQAVVVEPRMSAYTKASEAVFEVFERTTPLVEGLSIDEAFLDVGGLRRLSGPAPAIAGRLRRDVRDRVGLPITVGVARTKFLAKVASAVGKPDGLLVVPPDRELAFLHPLRVERLWGVGPVTAEKLRSRGITSVGEVSELGEGELVAMLGKASGRHLHALAHNRDPRPVQGRAAPALDRVAARTRTEPEDADDVDAAVVALVDRVTRRMRAAGRVGRTVCCCSGSTTSRARRGHNTLTQATAQRGRSSRRCGSSWRRPRRPSSGKGSRSSASRSATSTTTPRSSSQCRSTGGVPAPTASTPLSTRYATGSVRAPSPAPCCSAGTTIRRCPSYPIETSARSHLLD